MQLHLNAASNLKLMLPDIMKNREQAAVYFKLSLLDIKKENKEHITIAINILRDQLRTIDGQIYPFADGDILIIFANPNSKIIQESIFQIRYLFEDHFRGLSADEMIKLFNLKTDFNDFKNLCETKVSEHVNDNNVDVKQSLISFITEKIETNLDRLDWNEIIREDFIYASLNNNQPKKVIRELKLDYNNLLEHSGKNIDIYYNSQLKGFFKEYTDLQLLIKLANIAADFDAKDLPVIAELAAETLTSDDFDLFTSELNVNLRKQIIIGIHVSDVFKDLESFIEIRDMLLGKGYKLLLSGLDNLSFLHTDRKQLGFDLIKMNWQPNLSKQNYVEFESELRSKINVTGASRIIWSNCSMKKSLETGSDLGICLFQGSLFDVQY